jgi:hypothetical protein
MTAMPRNTPMLAPIALAAWLVSAPLAHAADNLMVNGSLKGVIGNSSVPTGWQILLNSPDVMDGANNAGVSGLQYFGATPEASPDGGTWVGLGARTGSYMEEFGQWVDNLVIGQAYTLSWVVGNFGYSKGSVNYLDSNAIRVNLDGALLGTGSTLGVGSQWSAETLSFVATTTRQQLSFQLANYNNAYLSIDGINLTAVSAVPEPGTFGLALLGLGALMWRARGKA